MLTSSWSRGAVRALVLVIGAALAACTTPMEPTDPYGDDIEDFPFGEISVVGGAHQ